MSAPRHISTCLWDTAIIPLDPVGWARPCPGPKNNKTVVANGKIKNKKMVFLSFGKGEMQKQEEPGQDEDQGRAGTGPGSLWTQRMGPAGRTSSVKAKQTGGICGAGIHSLRKSWKLSSTISIRSPKLVIKRCLFHAHELRAKQTPGLIPSVLPTLLSSTLRAAFVPVNGFHANEAQPDLRLRHIPAPRCGNASATEGSTGPGGCPTTAPNPSSGSPRLNRGTSAAPAWCKISRAERCRASGVN